MYSILKEKNNMDNNNRITLNKFVSKPPLNIGPNSKILKEYKMTLENLSKVQ
jgi:hypothetical protein